MFIILFIYQKFSSILESPNIPSQHPDFLAIGIPFRNVHNVRGPGVHDLWQFVTANWKQMQYWLVVDLPL